MMTSSDELLGDVKIVVRRRRRAVERYIHSVSTRRKKCLLSKPTFAVLAVGAVLPTVAIIAIILAITVAITALRSAYVLGLSSIV